ncbi:MAG: hypothetical protein M1833_004170 [Piccolia ochrophora]|nr:MAG: hypothetical protein M1833_004170 [Piccolia ochrophora]
MPPKDSFMYWFLTDRTIHLWITMGTLSLLAIFTFFTNFRRTSPFSHMLPPPREIFSHPISFLSSYVEVFKLHTAHTSAETAERRKRKVDDVQKRDRYRKAHGLDQNQGFGGWTARSDSESLGPALPTDARQGAPVGETLDPKDTYTDFEGRKRPVRKWLGIW